MNSELEFMKENYEPFKSADEVQTKIEEMAQQVVGRYKDKNPLFICLLQGGAPFATKLMFACVQYAEANNIDFQPNLDYMIVSTYGTSQEAKESRIILDLAPDTKTNDRTIVLIDDLIDTGRTLEFIRTHLMHGGASEVDTVVLVTKQVERTFMNNGATLSGFDSPNRWLTGMGMDEARIAPDANRWAGWIAIAKEAS